LNMTLEAFSREFSTSILRLIETTEKGTKILAIVDGIVRTVSESSPRRNLKLRDKDGISSLPDADLFENFWSTARIETTEKGTKILAIVDGIVRTVSESSPRRNLKLRDKDGISSLPDADLFENVNNPSFSGRIVPLFDVMMSSALPPVADEPASPVRDVSQGEACPSDFGFITDQDMETIAKSSTLPYDSAPRVTSHVADEGSLGGRDSQVEGKATKRISDETEEMEMVLTSIDATTVIAGGIDDVPTGSGSIPTAGPPAADIPTGSDVVPTASPVFATATKLISVDHIHTDENVSDLLTKPFDAGRCQYLVVSIGMVNP
nr:hypothetical protein [Tanacetum cinerariifolium]